YDALCEACRRGDIESVETLVTGYNIDVNIIDNFDYSPLILASLCGHIDVVRYLLENGAVCDRDTFQGERCLYGALTDEIRDLLISFDISKAVDSVQPFAAHIYGLLNRSSPVTADFIISNTYQDQTLTYPVHKFVLIARSAMMTSILQSKISQDTAKDLTMYRIEGSKFSPEALKSQILLLSAVLGVQDLVSATYNLIQESNFDECTDKATIVRRTYERHKECNRLGQKDFETFLKTAVLPSKVVGKSDDDKLESVAGYNALRIGADIIIRSVDDDSGLVTLYPVHRAMLLRSPYYEAMFSSSFAEASLFAEEPLTGEAVSKAPVTLPITSLDVTPQILEIVLQFVYTDQADIDAADALEVLRVADALCLDRLKTLASLAICNSDGLSGKNLKDHAFDVFDILYAGWDYGMDRLEELSAKHIAQFLDEYKDDARLSEAILRSAQRINERQETDTIELIDNIRYFLSRKYNLDI
ncbi:hypothetical protein CANCADRAFT_13168, partial [Tortispora caseinolytica NRRL Y-17796]